VLVVAALLVAAVVAAVGGLALRAPGVVAVGVAGLLAALTAAAIAHDGPSRSLRSTVEAAALALAGTVGGLLVVSGTAALAGGAVTVGLLAAAVLAFLLHSGRRSDAVAAPAPAGRPAPGWEVVPLAPALRPGDDGHVASLSTAALGREWLRTTAALAGRVDPATRRSIVERREATLDELERRDPEGFSRWLSDGPLPGSDPAAYVRGGPVRGTEAA
jgi:hypothetical protein